VIYLKKSYPKVNIFLKITGYKDGYHTISSRFMKVKSLYDTISFIPTTTKSNNFRLEGFDTIPVEQNIITKAYNALFKATKNRDILKYFSTHKVYVEKNIPTQAGLGGGSSNAGVFLNMTNEVCRLGLNKDELAQIGSKIGADVPFFIYDFDSANVTGFGEIVEKFEEEALDLEIFTPPVACNTKAIYQKYRANNLGKDVDFEDFRSWTQTDSKTLLSKIKEPKLLNDLFLPALSLCPELKEYQRDGYYFSGSGSSFFRMI